MALQCDVSYTVFNRMDNLAIVIMQQVAAVQITPRSAWGLLKHPTITYRILKPTCVDTTLKA